MKIQIFTILLLLIFNMSYAKEFTQEEADRYNYLFKNAEELVVPFLHFTDVKHSKADKKKLTKAIEMYNEAIFIHPGSWQSMWLRGKAYQALENTEAAYESFKQAYKLMPENPDVVNEYIQESINLNKINEALNINQKAVASFPDNIKLRANYALILILAGHIEQSLDQGRLAQKMDPNDEITKRLITIAQEIKTGKRKQPTTIYELSK